MKKILSVSAFCIGLLVVGSAAPVSDPASPSREKEPRFKGVELYSWKGEEKSWNFVLLDGTNREKREVEIKTATNRIVGVEKLGKAFGRLAVDEQVFWVERAEGFDFPPVEMRKKIAGAAKRARISLDQPALPEERAAKED